MDYFYDTEFIETGESISLISIGIVCEDGREYYAVSTTTDLSKAGEWVRKNVINQLPNPSSKLWKSNSTIRDDLAEFFHGDRDIRLWAWVGAYDHVCLAQLWGTMPELPRRIPRYTREIKHFWEILGRPTLPPAPTNAHDALADARHNVEKFNLCRKLMKEKYGLDIGATL